MVNQVFESVDQQRWDDIKATILKETGVAITDDKGASEYKGVKFSWAWGGDDLAVEVVSVSWEDKLVGETEKKAMSQFAEWIGGVE